MKRKVDFDWYCKTKKDVINNAAYELIVALTAKSAPPRKFELSIPQWDDLMIANIVENAINAIDERIGYYCHPFYHEVDKLPCYLGDRCDNPHCIFKSDPDYTRPTPYAAKPVVPAGPTQEELDAEYIRICQGYDPSSEEWTVDRYNRRWIMCTVCGRIKQDAQMSYYGGKGGANRGVCADCSRNGRS